MLHLAWKSRGYSTEHRGEGRSILHAICKPPQSSIWSARPSDRARGRSRPNSGDVARMSHVERGAPCTASEHHFTRATTCQPSRSLGHANTSSGAAHPRLPHWLKRGRNFQAAYFSSEEDHEDYPLRGVSCAACSGLSRRRPSSMRSATSRASECRSSGRDVPMFIIRSRSL